MKKALLNMKFALAIAVTVAGMSVFAEETNAVAAVSSEDVVAALRAENDALRKENQTLRRELVAKTGSLPDGLLPDKVVEPEVKLDLPEEDTGYWISQKSKIRHNKRCRNYRKVKGKPCGPNDGKPCKNCGG